MSETPYTKEEFLKEVNSDNFYTRLQAIGRSKYCYELTSEMGAEYRDIIRNIAVNDASRQVRSEAIKVCQNRKIKDKNGNSIVLPDEELQLPDNITEIMESVFKRGKVGPKTQKISPSIYVKIQRAFVKACPDTYALIRDIYPKGAQFKRFLTERLSIYRKKCRCEEYAKKKSGLPPKNIPYELDQDLDVINKKFKYKEIAGELLPVNYKGTPNVPITLIRKCMSHGFKIVSCKSTQLYQIRNAETDEVVVGEDFNMTPGEINSFIHEYEYTHPLMLPPNLFGLYFPDLYKRVESTYNKIGEGHTTQEYIEKFREQHKKAIKKYMIDNWCGKKNYNRTNPGVNDSLSMIFAHYIKQRRLSNAVEMQAVVNLIDAEGRVRKLDLVINNVIDAWTKANNTKMRGDLNK